MIELPSVGLHLCPEMQVLRCLLYLYIMKCPVKYRHKSSVSNLNEGEPMCSGHLGVTTYDSLKSVMVKLTHRVWAHFMILTYFSQHSSN